MGILVGKAFNGHRAWFIVSVISVSTQCECISMKVSMFNEGLD